MRNKVSTVLTEKSFQRLQNCKCDVISADPLFRTLRCHYKEAKSLMFLTNNVFYKKRKENQPMLVAKTEEILEVIQKVRQENGGMIPEKRYLTYPRNLICILFCGTIPSWVTEQDVLQAVSQLNAKSKQLVESLYCERMSKKQAQKKFGLTKDGMKRLEQESFACLLQSLE